MMISPNTRSGMPQGEMVRVESQNWELIGLQQDKIEGTFLHLIDNFVQVRDQHGGRKAL